MKNFMQEEGIGSIDKVKSADMTLLKQNKFEIPTTDIHKTRVQTTIFKGETA